MKRSLRLTRDTLSALTPDELGEVAGAHAITAQGRTCPLIDCAGLRSWVGQCQHTFPECP